MIANIEILRGIAESHPDGITNEYPFSTLLVGRLEGLLNEGLLERIPGRPQGFSQFRITAKGRSLISNQDTPVAQQSSPVESRPRLL